MINAVLKILNSLTLLLVYMGISNPIIAQTAVDFGQDGKPKHNIFSFRAQSWQDHFKNLNRGAILVDTKTRSLHYWNKNGTEYKVFPTSVPLNKELTRLGYTKVTKKVVGPEWRPTKKMRERDPQLPEFMPPGPDNPLGSHALYLSWPSYRIHGTSDTRKIGRQSSSGCVGLYNEQIEELFNLVEIGTPVRIL
jgi:lipoprotein-anchoring transpeptidase ErfK/SrfK|tara:strand:- start:73 stop:651 length:579 start_codon:yes stop_codon:yes gene_type:complete